jgi:starch phosphorylase
MEEVGSENIFIFGLTAQEASELYPRHIPRAYYEKDPLLKETIDLIYNGFFSPENPTLFHPLMDLLLNDDRYLVLADFEYYHQCQQQVNALYLDRPSWTRKTILNVARMGRFSSDRTVMGYNEDIWRAKSLKIIQGNNAGRRAG